MRIELAFARARYTVGEDVPLRVRLVNDGAEALAAPDPFHATSWQPVYHVWRDGDAEARRVSFRRYRFDDPRDPPEDAAPVLITLAPGEVREDDVPFRAWAHLDEPGRYHVVATLAWEGASARSEEAAVEVTEFAPAALSIGVNVGVEAVRDLWVSWLDRGPDGAAMGQTLFREARPDLGEIERRSAEVLHPLRPSVVAVYAPWTAYDRAEELGFWRAWRDGQHLAAMEASQPGPHWYDLGEGGAVLHPVVMSRAGDLTACVRAADGTLRAVRFTSAGVEELLGPALPGELHAARVAPEPRDEGASFVVAALCEDADGAVCGCLARFDGATGWAPAVRFAAPELAPTPRCAVGVTARDGGARAGFVALTREGASLVVVEVDPAGTVSVREDLGRADDPPWATAAAWGLSPGAAPDLHWVALLSPDRAFSSRGHAPGALPDRPLMPLELLPISQSLYLAVHDPHDGVGFHMLR